MAFQDFVKATVEEVVDRISDYLSPSLIKQGGDVPKSLAQLKATIKDYARPNKFSLKFTIPSLQSINTTLNKTSGYLVKTLTPPTAGITNIEIPRMGKRISYPGDPIYTEVVITFKVDDNHDIYNAFIQWMNSIVDFGDGQRANELVENYFNSDLTIWQLDRKMGKRAAWVIFGIFPSIVGDIAYSMDSESQVAEFQVTFQYSYFVYAQATPGGEVTSLVGRSPFGDLIESQLGSSISAARASIPNIFTL